MLPIRYCETRLFVHCWCLISRSTESAGFLRGVWLFSTGRFFSHLRTARVITGATVCVCPLERQSQVRTHARAQGHPPHPAAHTDAPPRTFIKHIHLRAVIPRWKFYSRLHKRAADFMTLTLRTQKIHLSHRPQITPGCWSISVGTVWTVTTNMFF